MGDDNSTSIPLVMRLEEYIAVLYVVNLHLAGMDGIAIEIIEKQLSKLNGCRDLFKGNIKRLHALCLFTLAEKALQTDNNPKEFTASLDKVLKLLKQSEHYFKMITSHWGLALVYY